MHDIADLERRGVVGVFLASEAFADAARPHPVQDRTDEELRAVADAVYPAVLAAVTAAP